MNKPDLLIKKLRANVNKNVALSLVFISILTFGCIEKFKPDIDGFESLLVVDGSIIKGDSLQRVIVSTSTEIIFPEFNPLSGCTVEVQDEDGNKFQFTEESNGEYTAAIPDEHLFYGKSYQLKVVAGTGEAYESEWETIYESSAVDSLYYEAGINQSSGEEYETGVQIFVDLKAPPGATKNYMWRCYETWEIHTVYSIDGYWHRNDINLPRYEPRNSTMICWQTEKIRREYTSSTSNLTINEKKKIPITFIEGVSPKLNYRYSMLVKQFALSDEAYRYHNQNNIALVEGGGLYTAQPGQTRSNLRCTSNPDQKVLGFFWASSFSEKRIFIDGPYDYFGYENCDYVVPCDPPMGLTLLEYFMRLNKSVYLVALDFHPLQEDSVTRWGYPFNQLCIECTVDGGTTEKPDFW